METLARILNRHTGWILAILAVITLGLGLGLRKIEIARSIEDDNLPSSNELVLSMKHLVKTFGDDTRQVVIAVESQTGAHVTDKANIDLIADISAALKLVPTLKRESILSITNVKDVISRGDDIVTESVVENPPRDAAEQAAIEQKIAKNPFIYGRLISKDFKTTLVIASAYVDAEVTHIHEQVEKVLAPHLKKVPGTVVNIVGEPEVSYQLQTSIERDAILFVSIAIAMTLLAFFWVFRSWQGVVLPFLTILLTIIWTMGLVGYWGEPVTILGATMPVVLVVIGSTGAIHIYHHLLEELRHGMPYEKTLSTMFKAQASPVFMANITTFLGGLSLLTFKIRTIQHFGVFTAIGTVLSLVISVTLIPSLHKLLGGKLRPAHEGETEAHAHSDGLLDRALKACARLASQHSILVVLIVPVLVGASIFYMNRIQIGFDTLAVFPKNNPIRLTAERLDEAFGGTRSYEVLIDSKKPGGALEPEFIAKVKEFEQKALQVDKITHSFSIAHLIEKVHSVVNPDGALTRDTVAQYLFLLGMSETGLPVRTLVTSDERKVKVSLTVNTADTHKAEEIYFALKDLGKQHFGEAADVIVGGRMIFAVALQRYLVWGKVQNVFSSILTVILLLLLRYRSFTRSFITVIPLTVSVMATFGIMGLLGIRLDYVTAIITSFAMGMGVEYSIHFMSAVRRNYKQARNFPKAIEQSVTGPGKAILYNAFCVIAGFGVLVLSRFSSINTFAILICFNMLILILFTFLVIPAVVRISEPVFITGRSTITVASRRRLLLATKVAFSAVIIGFLTWGIFATEARTEELPKASDLIKKTLKAAHPEHEESIYVMKLIGGEGEEGARRMNVWFKSEGKGEVKDEYKLMVKFVEPASIRGTGFLSIIKKDSAAEQWLYLPSLKKSRRISGGSNSESFLGSDFSMGDISVDTKGDWEFKTTGSKKCGETGKEVECWVLEGVPTGDKAKDSAYSKQILNIRKDNFLTAETQFFNPSGQLEKVMTMEGIKKEGDRWAPSAVQMKNVLANHRTVIEYEKRDISKKPADHVFTKAFLEK